MGDRLGTLGAVGIIEVIFAKYPIFVFVLDFELMSIIWWKD
jgi:hypothetical protein